MMKYLKFKLFFALVLLLPASQLFSQTEVYTVTSGELLFQWADIGFTEAYQTAHPNDKQVANPLRFTCFFHVGQYVHMNFNDNLGFFTGGAIRNVGFISDEKLDLGTTAAPNIQDFKIIRRSYTLGIPLAIKLGSFSNHTYLFGGGEMELAFAYKEKYWNANTRSGAKTKNTEWFPSQSPTFIPSVFAGIQFPGGVNVKFKYYLENFINNKYTSSNPVYDLTRYDQTQVMYVSLSWQFKTKNATKKLKGESVEKFSSL